jgi:hypothetical protein
VASSPSPAALARPAVWWDGEMVDPSRGLALLPPGPVTIVAVDAASGDPGRGEIVHEISAQHGGIPLAVRDGGALLAAFARPSDAVRTALELRGDPALTGTRVAIHTGETQAREEGNDVGAVAERTLSLLAAANHGQILVSEASHELVVDSLPPGIASHDFGLHRLRDLGRPEHVYGVRRSDLPSDVLPPRSLEILPNNLPVQLTSFVGRKEEIRQVRELLAEVPLLTLTGSGGCGKTRLALHLPPPSWSTTRTARAS